MTKFPPVVDKALLSIDSAKHSGWAVVTIEAQPRLLLWDEFTFPGKRKKVSANTATSVVKAVTVAISERTEFDLALAVIEDQYLDQGVKRNVDTLKKMARTSGRWEEACLAHGIPVAFLLATTWQSAELGLRKASREMLKAVAISKASAIFGEKLPGDAADAALMGRYAAIEFFWNGRVDNKGVKKSSGGSRRTARRKR